MRALLLRTWLWLLIAGSLLWAGPAARAATLLALDLGQLVAQSDLVVIARAQSESSRRRPDGNLLVTDVRLRVVESLKGAAKPGETLVVTRLGGSLDGIGLTVPGEASFPEGKSVIVFLQRSSRSSELHVVGMSQGVLTIDGEGVDARVLPGGKGAALVQEGDDGMLRPAPDALLHPRPLREVLTEIRRHVAASNAP